MRTIIIITLVIVLPAILIAQQTYVPDDNFEQALIDLGYDTPPLNDSVPTANIDTVTVLWIVIKNISDLTGIEDFKALEILYCFSNDLTSIDISNNTALRYLHCAGNNLTSLDVSNNSTLQELDCAQNKLTRLDLSNNSVLRWLWCFRNSLTSLNIKNGNNKNMTSDEFDIYFHARGNPDLKCIQVDDSAWSANAAKWYKDEQTHYSEDCTKVGVEELNTFEPEISIFPNPFSQLTIFNYELRIPGIVVLNVYDIFGNEVATLLNEFKDAGTHKTQFNAGNLPQGIYFYKIQIDNATRSGKLLLIK